MGEGDDLCDGVAAAAAAAVLALGAPACQIERRCGMDTNKPEAISTQATK